MNIQLVFYFILFFFIFDFLFDLFFDSLNFNHRKKPLPEQIKILFNIETNQKQLDYQTDNYKFGMFASILSGLLMIGVLIFRILPWFDDLTRSFVSNDYLLTLAFFGLIFFASFIFSIPFDWYQTFVIEEKHGFNKTSKKTFVLDKIKSLLMTIVLGGLMISVLLWFYFQSGEYFWLYAWGFVAVFSIFMMMFYSNLIVPLFNKQSPIDEGELKNAIVEFCQKVNFKIKNVYIIDSSKRSTKTNAYFTGFGPKKRIVLYDNMIEKFSTDEIVAVLAHEIGHNKHKHTLIGLITSMISTGITFFLLGLLMNHPILSKALGNSISSFHMSLITFGLLYSPIEFFVSPFSSMLSRKFEYQADAFVVQHGRGDALKSALIKMTEDNLSNLNPHPLYVWFHYSHPPLIQRIEKIEKGF